MSPPASIGEALQDYADRTGRTSSAAYADWHAHGDVTAADWATREPEHPDLALRGGRALGLLPSDVARLG